GTERRHSPWLELLMGPGRLAQEYVHAHASKVGDVMTQSVISVPPETPLEEVVRLMERRRIKRVPVVENGRLAGIVSRSDLLSFLASFDDLPATAASDSEIRTNILTEVDKQPWAPRASIKVFVRDGVVELHGAIADEREREALRVACENAPGVKAVHDHLIWVEPISGMVIDAPR
ncbi:MAG TPA: CBS domain-containing protein, partial [Stellaceae bacterium]|nr:CBS domain-containing protein [Stellaceae bacterium]